MNEETIDLIGGHSGGGQGWTMEQIDRQADKEITARKTDRQTDVDVVVQLDSKLPFARL